MIRTVRNAVWIAVGQLGGRVAGLIASVYLARKLGPAAFGAYSLVLMLVYMAGQLSDLGVETYLTREVAAGKQWRPLASSALSLKVALSALGIFTLVVVSHMGLFDVPWIWVGVASLSLLPAAVANAYTAILNGWQDIAYTSRLTLVTNFLSALLTVVVAMLSPQLSYVFWVLALLAVGRLVVLRARVNKVEKITVSWHVASWTVLLKSSVPIYLLAMLGLLFFKVDSLILASMMGSQALGLYAAAYKIMEALLVLPQALTGALFPSMAKSSAKGGDAVFSLYTVSARMLVVVGLPIAVGGTIVAGRLMVLVFGQPYGAAGPALAVLLWALLVMFLNAPAGNVILTSDRVRQFIPYALLNTGLNLGLNLLVIPVLGYLGAAVVTLITEVTSYVINQYFIWKITNRLFKVGQLLPKPLFASALMALVVWLGRGLPVLWTIGTGGFSYALVMVLLGEIRALKMQVSKPEEAA